MSLKGLDVQRPAILEHAETIRSIVQREVGETFAPALEALRVLHYTAQECCERFHSVRAEGTARYEALARLTARGLLVADEIQHLLAGGYPSGALGRWRSLASRFVARDSSRHVEAAPPFAWSGTQDRYPR